MLEQKRSKDRVSSASRVSTTFGRSLAAVALLAEGLEILGSMVVGAVDVVNVGSRGTTLTAEVAVSGQHTLTNDAPVSREFRPTCRPTERQMMM
jgi:hypothetical protein